MTPTAIVNAKGEDRIRGGHPWIYRSDVIEVADVEPGIVVRVRGPRNRELGHALFSDQSQITLRMISRDDRAIDLAFWRERLERALSFREILEIDATAYRLVHGEADLLPSLVVDKYDDYLVIQALSQGMDRLTPTIVPLLVELPAPRVCWRGTIRKCGCLKDSSRRSRSYTARCPKPSPCARPG